MKRLRRLLAVIIAMVMVAAATNVAVFADEEQKDSGIEITGLAEGDVVHFYKVIGWATDEQIKEHADVTGWVATSDFSSVLTKDELGKAIDPNNANYTGITSELAGTLARVSGKTEIASVTVGADGKASLDISNYGLGTYMAIVTPVDVDTVYNPIFVSADYKAGDNSHEVTEESSYYNKSAAKKTINDLTKTYENDNDYNNDNGDTVAVGDTLTFTVTTTIPGYGQVFEEPTFVIKDKMEDLELKADKIKITVDGTDVADNDNNDYYTLAATTSGYTATFKTAYLKTLATPVNVVITYDAEVLESAKIANFNEEKNTVTVEYSHNPEDESSKKYKKDTTNHYTFSLDADNLFKTDGIVGESGSEYIKISVDSNGQPIYSDVNVWSNVTPTAGQKSPLAGAEFELKDANGNSFEPRKTATSDANGRIKFENLDAGTYKLVEISAPVGYVRDTTEHTIEIKAVIEWEDITEYFDEKGEWYTEGGEGRTAYTYNTDILKSYTVTFDGENVATHTFVHTSTDQTIKWSSSESHELPSSIRNTKGVELPSTGGMGTTIFYVIGSILVIGAGIILVTRRRMNAN